MKKILLLAFLLAPFSAFAQFGPPTSTGGMTREVCAVPTVSTAAYTSGDIVGGLITLQNVWRSVAQGAPDQGGILQSIRLIIKSVQTGQFNLFQFSANPDSTTWTDHAAPALDAADAFKPLPPIQLINYSAGLSSNGVTIYGADAIARARAMSPTTTSDFWVIIAAGTPTFSSTSDVQFCATYLLD